MQEVALPTQLEILKKSRERVLTKRGADDPFVKSLDEKIAAAEKAEAKVTITANADMPGGENTSAEGGKTPTTPQSGKQSNNQFRVKTQGSARSR
jgi:hypothetical protein